MILRFITAGLASGFDPRRSRRTRFTADIIDRFSLLIFALVLIGVGGGLSPALAQQGREEPWAAMEKSVPTAPVVVDGRILFRICGVTAFPPKERARGIEERIVAVARDRAIPVTALRLVQAEHSVNILAGDQLIMGVFDTDVRLEAPGLSRQVLAQVYLRRIASAIQDYRSERTPERLLRDTAMAAGATIALVLLLFGIIRGFRWLTARIERRYQLAIERIEERSLRFISAQSIWAAVHFLLHALSVVAMLALVYLYLHFVLALYPWTRIVAINLRAAVLDPALTFVRGVFGTVPNLVLIALIVVATRYVLRVTHFFFSAVREGRIKLARFEPEWADSTYKIVRVLIVAFAIVVCYPYIPGSESPAFKGVSIFLGVLFSIGSSSFLANIIAGYTMTYRRAFHVGDRIRVGDLEGDVREVGLMVTRLRSIKNEEFVVPNSLILTSNVINYSALAQQRGLILHATVGIGYDTPWRQVEAMLLTAAERTSGLLRQPSPFVLQKSLGDFAVTYEINVYCDKPSAMYELYTELHRNILDVFNEYQVQIMTPAYHGDPAAPKVVPRDQWFAAPAEAAPVRKAGIG
jgi:small-conductance mechanosensitive channel